jgi:hypothetical protein
MVMSSESFRNDPPSEAMMQAVGELVGDAVKAGAIVDMGGLMPTAHGACVRLSGGKVRVIDGPFAEAREVAGGYAIFSLDSKEEAVEWARRLMELHILHMPGWEGECHIRQIADA